MKNFLKLEPESSEIKCGLSLDDLNLIKIDASSQNVAIYPRGSIIDDWMYFGRQVSEAPDSAILGAIIPVLGAALGRNIHKQWAGRLYPNIYANIVGNPGTGKSTLIKCSEAIARKVLPFERIGAERASEEALFETMDPNNGGCSDKLFVFDEGNSLMSLWTSKGYGQNVGTRMLKLFDCSHWSQAFKKDKNSDGQPLMRDIEELSASMVLGTTMNVASFQGLESRDGMRRRFLTYFIKDSERTIYNPIGLEGELFDQICLNFSMLLQIEGRIEYDKAGALYWKKIQDENRMLIKQNNSQGVSDMAAVRGAILKSEPTYILKVGMIFACCDSLSDYSCEGSLSPFPHFPPGTPQQRERIRKTPILTERILRYSQKHVQQCRFNSFELDSLSQASQIAQEAEKVYTTVFEKWDRFREHLGFGSGLIVNATRSELTNIFCNNPSRGFTIDRLYNTVIPQLVSDKLCVIKPGSAKPIYSFKYEEKPRNYEAPK